MKWDPATGWVRWAALLLITSSCGAIPTTTDTTLISPNLLVVPTPAPRTPPPLPVSLPAPLPSDELALTLDRRGSDWVATLPATHVNRWLAREKGTGVEWIDVNLTVGSYRQTATAQLRADQSAVFTFSGVPSSGQARFQAVAFYGPETLAEGSTEFALSGSTTVAATGGGTIAANTPTANNSSEQRLIILNQTQVPVLQGIRLSSGQIPTPTASGRVADSLNPNQDLTLLGQNFDRADRILWLSSTGADPVVTSRDEILESSSTRLRIQPPRPLERNSIVMVVDSKGLGLGALMLTWQMPSTPTPSPTAPPSPTPTPVRPDWRILPLTINEGTTGSWLNPQAIVVAPDGSIYIADQQRHQILRRDPEGRLQRVAGNGVAGDRDGSWAEAQFNQPVSLAWDLEGQLLVVDQGNHRIRRLTREGQVETVAGSGQPGWQDGVAAMAQFRSPQGLALTPEGILYIADTGNHRIRRLTPEGTVTTLAGGEDPGEADGSPDESQLNQPTALAWDPGRQSLWISDTGNHRIRRLTRENILVTAVGSEAGLADGPLDQALLRQPTTLAVDPGGTLWIVDQGNQRIRRLSGQNRLSSLDLLPPGGSSPSPQVPALVDLAPDTDGSWVILTETGLSRIRPSIQP